MLLQVSASYHFLDMMQDDEYWYYYYYYTARLSVPWHQSALCVLLSCCGSPGWPEQSCDVCLSPLSPLLPEPQPTSNCSESRPLMIAACWNISLNVHLLRKRKYRWRGPSSLLQYYLLCHLTLSTKRWRSHVILIHQILEAAELSDVDIALCCWRDYWNNLISPEIR